MKYAIFSDIHANPKAFFNAVEDARSLGCEKRIILGDIVGYGPDPSAAIALAKKMNTVLLGNHDAAMCGRLGIDWFNEHAATCIKAQSERVSAAEKLYLQALPYQHITSIGNLTCAFSHGSLTCPKDFRYIEDYCDASFELSSMKRQNIDLLFVGHTHEAISYEYCGHNSFMNIIKTHHLDFGEAPLTEQLFLEKNHRYIFNVGSVGYPRNQRESIYVIFDSDEASITYRRLPFDFAGYCDDLKEKGIPVPYWLESHLLTHPTCVPTTGIDSLAFHGFPTQKENTTMNKNTKKTVATKKAAVTKKPAVKAAAKKPVAKKPCAYKECKCQKKAAAKVSVTIKPAAKTALKKTAKKAVKKSTKK